eukprot:5307962-Alexandrium_andersonii.AAC.1
MADDTWDDDAMGRGGGRAWEEYDEAEQPDDGGWCCYPSIGPTDALLDSGGPEAALLVRGEHNARSSDMSDWEAQAAAEERDIRVRLQLLDPPEYVCGVALTY